MRLLLAAVFLSVSISGSAGTTQPLRQSFDLEVPSPPIPVMVDGKRQLVYELHLTNFAPVDLELTRLDVLDAGTTAAPLASWQGDPLARRIGIPGAGKTGATRVIAPGMHAVVYIETSLDKAAAIPRMLKHRVAFDVVEPAGREHVVVQGGDAAVDPHPVPALGPPLRGGPWIAIYDPAARRGHRRVTFAIDGRVRIPARFAIDWMKLDSDGRYARGDQAKVANWYGYGEDVLAVADGTVVATRNSMAESPILSDVRNALEDASGNFVTLDLGEGRYATYEHLRPGSVRANPGEHVRRGQVIAALGYTGDSTGPHLHFHVSNGNAPLAGEGMPYVIAQFDAIGAYPSMDAFAKSEPWVPEPQNAARTRRMEFPAANTVVDFGAAAKEESKANRSE
ncbi:M23 family metallopeptidase [Dokdonella soli]|uniref:M23 family metallopeptidase n=2 Tax=Dokdonella soli TaxID=529810 RepID=A0ABN1IDG8_9GAMM